MSQENVEIVRGIYDALARRDANAAFEAYAEDIVWDMSRTHVAAFRQKHVYEGHEGVREIWREGLEIFGEVDMQVEELVEAGEQVLAFVREREVGRVSGAPVEWTHVALWTLTGGKVIRLQVFDDRREALEAVGLTE
jgi:ketosteroid isomerase-like protein